nr:hypothetical protein B0A51_02485 [Rachicladosporium sp. CCFEE 5018]
MSSSAMLNAKNVSKRKASPIRGPSPKRTTLPSSSAVKLDEGESDEVEFVVGVPPAKFDKVAPKSEGEYFPLSAAQQRLSSGEAQRYRDNCRQKIRACCLFLCEEAKRQKDMSAATRRSINAAYNRYLVNADPVALADSIFDSLTDPIKLFTGSGKWSLHGCYFGVCDTFGYIGSSRNMAVRMSQHVSGVQANREGSSTAELKLWYEQCCGVDAEIETIEDRRKPRFVFLALNKRRNEGEFLEVMESVLVSIFDVFDTGRRSPYAKQVGLAKAMRPEGLPDRAWFAGNASLPVCMAYHSPESIAAGAAKQSGSKALPEDQVVRAPSIKQLLMFMDERQSAATSWSDSSKLRTEMKRIATSKKPLVHCQLCDRYMVWRTFRDSHKRTWEHRQRLPDDERKAADAKEKVKCKDCHKTYNKLSKRNHLMTKEHQYSLDEDKRDPDRWVYCILCDFVSWYRLKGQDNHEGSAPHTLQVGKLALALPEDIEARRAYCKFCKKTYQYNHMGEHLKTYVHKQAVWAYEANPPADDGDEVAEESPAVASSSKVAAPRLKAVAATTALDAAGRGRSVNKASKPAQFHPPRRALKATQGKGKGKARAEDFESEGEV